MNGTKNEAVNNEVVNKEVEKKEYSGIKVLIYLVIVLLAVLAWFYALKDNLYLTLFIAFAGVGLSSWVEREGFLLKKTNKEEK